MDNSDKTVKIIKWFIAAILFLIAFFFIYDFLNVYTRSYWLNSQQQITNKLETWNKSAQTNYQEQTNDTIKAVYEVFDAFFCPKELSRIKKTKLNIDYYNTTKYLIVQNTVEYCVLPPKEYFDSVRYNDQYNKEYQLKNIKEIAFTKYISLLVELRKEYILGHSQLIADFRPQTHYPPNTVLYSDPLQFKEIEDFLSERGFNFGFDYFYQSCGIIKPKPDFLEDYLRIYKKQDNTWQIITQPYVDKIVFNSGLTEATVSFSLFYLHEDVVLEKKSGRWDFANNK